MRFFPHFLLFTLVLLMGCNKKVADTATPPDAPTGRADGVTKTVAFGGDVMLKIGETCKLEKSAASLKFLAVVEDSRCPKGVNCIRAGEAVIMVEVNGENRRLIIDTDPKTITRTPIEGGTIEVLGLSPYPEARIRIDPAQRAIRIRALAGEKMK